MIVTLVTLKRTICLELVTQQISKYLDNKSKEQSSPYDSHIPLLNFFIYFQLFLSTHFIIFIQHFIQQDLFKQIIQKQILMKTALLKQKIQSLKAASNYQYKLIDSIYNIMSMKRKAEFDYQIGLESVNKQLQKYITSNTGFLTDIVKSYQSYITTLIEGYDNEILLFLRNAKDNKLEQTLLKKIDTVDQQLKQCKQKILQYKKLIKQNYEELQLIDSQFRLGQKFNKTVTDDQKRIYANKYNDLLNLKKLNQQSLELHIDSMMNISMLHDQTLLELQDYENVYLQKKANDVFDNFMRAFVLEVSFIRSLQFDVGNILTKVKEGQQEQRKVVIAELRNSMKRQNSKVGTFIWKAYRKWIDNSEFDIKQHYISPRVRQKWQRVCQYYNQAY